MTLGIDVHDHPIMRPRFDTRVRLVNDASKRNHKKFKGLRRELKRVRLLVATPAAQALVVPGLAVNC